MGCWRWRCQRLGTPGNPQMNIIGWLWVRCSTVATPAGAPSCDWFHKPWCLPVHVSGDDVTVDAAKWNTALVNVIIYTHEGFFPSCRSDQWNGKQTVVWMTHQRDDVTLWCHTRIRNKLLVFIWTSSRRVRNHVQITSNLGSVCNWIHFMYTCVCVCVAWMSLFDARVAQIVGSDPNKFTHWVLLGHDSIIPIVVMFFSGLQLKNL